MRFIRRKRRSRSAIGALLLAAGAIVAATRKRRPSAAAPVRGSSWAPPASARPAPTPSPPPAAAPPPPAPVPTPGPAPAGDVAAPDDATLAREVEEEIAKSGQAPEGGVDVEARDGIVQLHAAHQSDEQRRAVFDAAARTDGVRGVQDPGQPRAEDEDPDGRPPAA